MRKYIIPEGTRDLIENECVKRKKIIKEVNYIFHKWGYDEVITPTVEFYDLFCFENNGLREEDMYKFFDNTGRILVLKPDMTVPIARVVGTKFKDYDLPIRLRYESNVYRVHESLGGKRNEYTDCGVELIGLDSKDSDLEILVTALEVLEATGVKEYKLEIGDVHFFKAAIESLEIDEEKKEVLSQLIEKKSLKELNDFLDNLNIDLKTKKFFKRLPWIFGGKEVLDQCEDLVFNSGMRKSLEYLRDIYSKLQDLGYESKITFDLGMAPRLNYYTGLIFRGYVEGVGNTALSGGRYDNLISSFGVDLKAIGFSINIDCLIPLVKENATLDNEYMVYFDKRNELEAMKEGKKLRDYGYRVHMMPREYIDSVEIKLKEASYGN